MKRKLLMLILISTFLLTCTGSAFASGYSYGSNLETFSTFVQGKSNTSWWGYYPWTGGAVYSNLSVYSGGWVVEDSSNVSDYGTDGVVQGITHGFDRGYWYKVNGAHTGSFISGAIYTESAQKQCP